MKNNFEDTYQINSIRLSDDTHAMHGLYFITICIKDKECCLGTIYNGVTYLSDQGKLAQQYWLEIPAHFENSYLGAFIVMPYHIHGIIGIDNRNNKMNDNDPIGQLPVDSNVLAKNGGIMGKHHPLCIQHSLEKIIRWYKGRCTLEIRRQLHVNFEWQSRFHDHMIKNHQALINIENYIAGHSFQWSADKHNTFTKRY